MFCPRKSWNRTQLSRGWLPGSMARSIPGSLFLRKTSLKRYSQWSKGGVRMLARCALLDRQMANSLEPSWHCHKYPVWSWLCCPDTISILTNSKLPATVQQSQTSLGVSHSSSLAFKIRENQASWGHPSQDSRISGWWKWMGWSFFHNRAREWPKLNHLTTS